MASFSIAYNLVAAAEGGYQNHPNDAGNYNSLGQLVGTNWGVSATKYERIIGRPPSAADMQNLSAAAAKEIFRNDEWARIRGNEIHDQAVANIFFDGAVNHGRGIHLMQEVLGVEQDGVVGPITLAAINTANPAQLYHAYKERRRRYYHWLVEWRPANLAFLDGWLQRLDRFQAYEVATAGIGGLLLLFGLGWLIHKNKIF